MSPPVDRVHTAASRPVEPVAPPRAAEGTTSQRLEQPAPTPAVKVTLEGRAIAAPVVYTRQGVIDARNRPPVDANALPASAPAQPRDRVALETVNQSRLPAVPPSSGPDPLRGPRTPSAAAEFAASAGDFRSQIISGPRTAAAEDPDPGLDHSILTGEAEATGTDHPRAIKSGPGPHDRRRRRR